MPGKSNNPFDQVVQLFDLYQDKLREDTAPASYPSRWVHEISKRFKQLYFVCDRIAACEKKILSMTDALSNPHSPRFSEFSDLLFETEFFVESFYFMAFRVSQILIKKHDHIYLFPALKNFEAPGVRDVRNHLLEHPERHGGVLNQSFDVGGNDGPRLKSALGEKDMPDSMDRGLWRNVNEFAGNLEKILKEAMARQ